MPRLHFAEKKSRASSSAGEIIFLCGVPLAEGLNDPVPASSFGIRFPAPHGQMRKATTAGSELAPKSLEILNDLRESHGA